ncbi:hypothetical protein [Flavobacterium psychrophilum]|uniref:hypothetical protein n=1 Tax=Flavobacterium psychrophilum TaxID=96345 RepID=UPI00106CFA2D|nr:hypothetical protein [Flavobacterium psychrophilum]
MKKLILLFLVFALFSCKNDTEVIPEIETPINDVIVDTPEVVLTDQEKYLVENGFKQDAGFTDSQFKEFKSAIETGLFKKESFCDVFRKSLKLSGNDLKSYLKKFRKIPEFETILFFYGPKVCDAKVIVETQTSSYSNSTDDANPCVMSEDFIKKDLYNPATADFSMFDCSTDRNSDGTYTIMRKVSAKNSLGVEKEYIYKLKLGFKGGNWVDISNWDLINMRSEEYR